MGHDVVGLPATFAQVESVQDRPAPSGGIVTCNSDGPLLPRKSFASAPIMAHTQPTCERCSSLSVKEARQRINLSPDCEGSNRSIASRLFASPAPHPASTPLRT